MSAVVRECLIGKEGIERQEGDPFRVAMVSDVNVLSVFFRLVHLTYLHALPRVWEKRAISQVQIIV